MLLIPANAKVNLCLAVRGRRADGFHDIDSVLVPIDWHDLVGIRLRPAALTTVLLRVAGTSADLPAGDANLATAAAHGVAAVTRSLDVQLWLDKRIPAAAGLGGGSADAAAVLRGCSSLLGGALATDEVLGLAASIGSDVPVLVAGGAHRVRGRGELLTPIATPVLHMTVAVVAGSSTAATYAAVQPVDMEDSHRAAAVEAALAAGVRPDDDLLGSGLEAAACRANPLLAERLHALRAAVPQARWHLTGSGGGVFALVAGGAAAAELARLAVDAGFPARACRTVSG